MPTVLVTGASRGIGLATAQRLLAGGWEVHAGVRRPEDAPAGTTPVILDVTDPNAVASLADALPERLDALVNNAGVVVPGPVECLALDDLRRQFEVNVVGQVGVTQAVLPRLRESRGRVVFVSSASGRVSAPLMGAYTASKFAVEALADALRLELRAWGIPVVLIEPGAIDTAIWRDAQATADDAEGAMRPEHRELYAAHLVGIRKLITRTQRQTSPAEKVAAAVDRALRDRRPRARYVVGLDARAQIALSTALPTRAMDAAVARITGMPSAR
jgi:NAD(P)-dependent dehydrogenase (short-subunit alcohol dehydrogenase family)